MDFKDQLVVVTGASRGIGQAFVEEFFRRGATVIAVSRSFSEEYLRPFSSDLSRVILRPTDLSSHDERESLIEELKANFDVALLVNNAGVLTGNFLEELEASDIEQCVQVNLLATIQLSRGLMPHFLKKKKGLIINNASVSAEFNFPGAQVYAATKAGVLQFSKCLSLELKGSGVSCLALLTPGVKTQMYDEVEDLFGDFLDLEFTDAISPQEWVRKVFIAMEQEKSICYPSGHSRAGLFLNRHLPWVYEKLLLRKYRPEARP